MTTKQTKKTDKRDKQIADLTADLQRTRADFENYRKRVESEKVTAGQMGESRAIIKLLPVIDTIERATLHVPAELIENKWVQGVTGLIKQLDKVLADLKLKRIDATPGVTFDPELHQAVQFDEEAAGDKEVIAEELQSGYVLDGVPLRHAMVKVTRSND